MFTEEQLGNPHAKVWVVSSQPKKGETVPMSSQNNDWFMQFVYAHELTVEDIRFEYLVNKVNRKGGLEVLEASGELETGVEELKERIEQYKPNVVLCLGAECLQHLLGQRDVTKWRGHLMPLPFCDVKAIFTFDPAAAHRQRFVHHTQYPGQYRTLMQFDIRKAIKARHTPELGHYEMDLTICTRYGPTISILDDMLKNSKIISFDIEVIKPYEGRLMDCLSIGDERNNNLCIPLWTPEGDPKKKATWGISRVWKNENEMAHIMLLVKQLMESSIPKVAQNSQYDITSLEYHYDIEVNNLIWDTMVAAHCLFCELPKDLGTLISLFTNIPYHKYLIHSASLADRWQYSAADAGANLHVMAGEIKEMAELDGLCGSCTGGFPDCIFCQRVHGSKLYQHYRETVHPMIRHCVDMHKDGVRIDPELRERMLSLEHAYQKQLKEAIHTAWPIKLSGQKDEYNINPKSPQQLNKLFYELLECKVVYEKGKRTMNDSARESIMKKDPRKEVQLLCKAIDAYIYSDASLLKFKVPPEKRQDGQEYIRTKYEPAGTDTGRLASKASDVIGAGTNLQNCEKGPQREMLIPEEGEEFIHVDLYAAEAFLNFLDAGELEGLKMISGLLPDQKDKFPFDPMPGGIRVMTKEVSDHLKIHNWMGEQVTNYYPDEAKEAGFKYKHAKQLIHALNYNVQPPMMARESGLPRTVCQWVFNMYHAKFPGIQERMKRIQRNVRMTTSMETALKRRRYFFADVNDKLFNVCYAWPNQSTIGEVTNRAMSNLRTWSEVDGRPLCLPVMNTHDGLVVRRRLNEDRDECIDMIIKAFNQPLVLRGLTIRIPVSIGFGPNFNDNFGEKVYFYPLEV
jgi:DNA polymerase I-like protein with 3'-5' exonuclease and polymerase domains